MINFKVKYNESFDEPILGIDWNSNANRILIARGNQNSLTLELKNSEGLTQKKGTLNIDGKLKDISLNESLIHALLIFDQRAILLNLQDFSINCEIERKDGFLDGTFANEELVYLKIPASSGSVDWSIWDIKNNDFQEYELERYDHYGRGAVMHPSKKLIGACWSAYQSGFLIHTTTPENNRLQYFDFGDNECSRSEYEAFAPSFNSRGDKIAFVVNPYLGGQKNIEKLCVYEIENQTQPVSEIELTDSEKESVKETFFIHQDDFILLNKTSSIDLVNLNTLETERILLNKIDRISVNTITGEFIVSNGMDLAIYAIKNKNQSDINRNNEGSIEFANSFISKHSKKLKIAGDEEIHFGTSISNTNEIPKVYVKFGFEKAIYRLDTKEVIEEKLSAKTKIEVDNWFNTNQESQLSKWKENNKSKKVTILKTEDDSLIEIFSGQRAAEPYPNVRVYFKNSDWMINVDESKERESLPDEIKVIVNNWIDKNYKEIIMPWEETFANNGYESMANTAQPETEENKSNFWSKLKSWWS